MYQRQTKARTQPALQPPPAKALISGNNNLSTGLDKPVKPKFTRYAKGNPF